MSILSALKIEISELKNPSVESTVPPLGEGEAQIWHWDLSASSVEVDGLRDLLSADELERAARYRFDKHRNEFALTRGILRVFLASHLGRSPETLRFVYSDTGKPSLDEVKTDLRFSVSHTDGKAMLALVRGREVGVDVEKIRPEPDAHKLAKRFFSTSEGNFLASLSGNELIEAFFRCWTLKEAYVKAKGGGLSIPLSEFDVSLTNDGGSALLNTRPDPAEAGLWTLQNLTVGPGFASALAIANAEGN